MTRDYRGREPFEEQPDAADRAFAGMSRRAAWGFVALVIACAGSAVAAAVAAGLVRW